MLIDDTSLSAQQRELVLADVSTSGVVVGAAGSGKTTVIEARVARLVRDGLVDPDEIAVLTPTRQGAARLRDALALAAGRATKGPLARSVAGFAFQILRDDAARRGEKVPRLLTGSDQDMIVAQLLDGDALDEAAGASLWPEHVPAALRDSRGFRSELRALLASASEYGVDEHQLARAGESSGRPAWEASARFLGEYRRVRAFMRHNFVDAAELVRRAAEIVGRDTDAPLSLRVVIADDVQEFSPAARYLLRALHRRGVAVLAFGDPDVAAGAFRGARAEHMAELRRDLGAAGALSVPQHGQEQIHALARRLATHVGTAGIVEHRAWLPDDDQDLGECVAVRTAVSAAEEYDAVARYIRERHLLDGVPWDEIAVIAHDSRQVLRWQEELRARDVEVRVASGVRPLAEEPAVRSLLEAVLLALDPPSDVTELAAAWERLLCSALGGLDTVAVRRLRNQLRRDELSSGGSRRTHAVFVEACTLIAPLDTLESSEARRTATVARILAKARDAVEQGANPHETLWQIWAESGLQPRLLEIVDAGGAAALDASVALDAVVLLFDAVRRFVERVPEESALTFVRKLIASDVADDVLAKPPLRPAVSIMTPAAALGTEFDTVAIVGMQEGIWPNTRPRGGVLDSDKLDRWLAGDDESTVDTRREILHDELRLLVRASSRATQRLLITAVDSEDEVPSEFFSLLPPAQPVQTLHALTLRGFVAAFRRRLVEDPNDQEAAEQLALLAHEGVPGARVDEWFGYRARTSPDEMRDRDAGALALSPSRIEAFEECGIGWAIDELGGSTSSAAAGLGTIIHHAMEQGSADEADLWSRVEERWEELEYEAPWVSEREKMRARDLVHRLSLYLHDFAARGSVLEGAESRFRVVISLDDLTVTLLQDDEEPPSGSVVMAGTIDRVEREADGRVVIVDLKTGTSAPSKDADVADHAQLSAYQLAFRAGLLSEGSPTREAGGAKLLTIANGTKTIPFREPRQEAMDDEAAQVFIARVVATALAMGEGVFDGHPEEHCFDERRRPSCAIHAIGQVSS